jgi:nicotinamidase-related amidase
VSSRQKYRASRCVGSQLKGKIVPLTQLDANAALVLIDLQKGVVGLQTVHPSGEIVGRSAQLAKAFRERGLPVVLVNVAGRAPGRTDTAIIRNYVFPPDWAELVPELEQQPGDLLVTKHRVGAFLGTPLDELLRARGVTQIFLAGVSTSGGVDSTARSAYDLGYNVVFVSDAMTDMNEGAHSKRVEIMFPRLGEVETTDGVLKVLAGGSR